MSFFRLEKEGLFLSVHSVCRPILLKISSMSHLTVTYRVEIYNQKIRIRLSSAVLLSKDKSVKIKFAMLHSEVNKFSQKSIFCLNQTWTNLMDAVDNSFRIKKEIGDMIWNRCTLFTFATTLKFLLDLLILLYGLLGEFWNLSGEKKKFRRDFFLLGEKVF